MNIKTAWLKYTIARVLKKLRIRRGSQLKQQLLREGRTRWVDLGSSHFEEGFMCVNLHASEDLAPHLATRYYQANLAALSADDREQLGQFDLIRMQHVFEHFSFEAGEELLKFCASMLKPGGYLLITVPDLRLHINGYLTNYRHMDYFRTYARRRLPDDAPASFMFAFHAHQFGYAPVEEPGQVHKWCYDYEGLKYQLEKVNAFQQIKRLDLLHPWAAVPFTHNVPLEDLCMIAQKI
ncbi:methyltransferase domain-containing protein [filamentous cyanobacterium LEGE 11480]|uniref:Methyltransferase domain-containing protein n=1 Tax=Romeriopsis navalis LEGE 11480 TaxID=2777977 RepID=A0A928VHS9_9CYAN|nr:methyltransferase domain-containing protein [Romeriopsis navalis]MBE9028851.1 methyltransferase domain-containing protein [Romeriopsis navalis LEGE 11480]